MHATRPNHYIGMVPITKNLKASAFLFTTAAIISVVAARSVAAGSGGDPQYVDICHHQEDGTKKCEEFKYDGPLQGPNADVATDEEIAVEDQNGGDTKEDASTPNEDADGEQDGDAVEDAEDEGAEEGDEYEGPVFFGHDLHDGCPTWARDTDEGSGLSRCEYDRPFMLSECPKSCLEIAEVSVETLTEEQLIEDAISGFGYLIADEYDEEDEEKCGDDHEECTEWAKDGDCLENPDFMLEECRRSCMVCFEPGVQSFEIGVKQRVEFYGIDEIRSQTIDVIGETVNYMVDEVMFDYNFVGVRRDCRNYDEKCSYWASKGECESDEVWMQQNCSPACGTCLSVAHWHRCRIDPDVHKDTMKRGQLNAMFERIVDGKEYARYGPVVLSRPYHPGEKGSETAEEPRDDVGYIIGPWIVRLENFLSEKESDRLIALGHEQEYELSTEVSYETNEDGTYAVDISTEGRTSTNAWCSDECYDDPVATRIRERIINMTGVPEENFEHLQLLKYEVDQFYEEHHDNIPHQKHLPCGPRILTVFMYLNDVEEGGETTFTTLNLTVAPKRGTALIWPSVLDEDLNEMDDRTFHMAMPVKRGQKFGANAWLHLRNYEAAFGLRCV